MKPTSLSTQRVLLRSSSYGSDCPWEVAMDRQSAPGGKHQSNIEAVQAGSRSKLYIMFDQCKHSTGAAFIGPLP